MAPLWDKTMSAESARELLDLLNSRTKKVDNVEPINYFVKVVEGDMGEFASLEGGNRTHVLISLYFDRVMQQIAPPETILKEEFWDTSAGQLLACVQYWLYGQDTVTVVETAKAIYNDSSNGSIASTLRLIERGRLKAIRKPEEMYKARRTTTKTGQGTSRSRLVLKSSLESFLAERKQAVK